MKGIIKQTAKLLDIEYAVVEAVINSYFETFYTTITKIKYNSLESFNKIKTNLVIPGFGKLVVTKGKKNYFNKNNKNGRD